MLIISRYLTREVVNALLAVTIVLVLAFLCQQVVRYLNYIAVGKIPTSVFLELVSFEAPYLLAIFLPLGLYIGILLTLGRLSADNELSILCLYGYGNQRLFRLVFYIALMVSVVVLILMLWINPWISAKRQQLMESDEATTHLVQTMVPGRFQVSPDGEHVMFVEKLSRDRQRAQQVFLAQEKKNLDPKAQPAWMLVLSDEGFQMTDKTTQEPLFVMTNGYRYEGMPGQNDYKIIHFKRYTIRIPQGEIRAHHHETETLSASELWADYEDAESRAELQWRFSIALSTILLALLAVPLSTLKPRKGRYIVLLPAILIYIVYINLLFIARHWVEEEIMLFQWGMWWVHSLLLGFIVFALYLERRYA